MAARQSSITYDLTNHLRPYELRLYHPTASEAKPSPRTQLNCASAAASPTLAISPSQTTSATTYDLTNYLRVIKEHGRQGSLQNLVQSVLRMRRASLGCKNTLGDLRSSYTNNTNIKGALKARTTAKLSTKDA
jgi:hypothetical protein